ncbi:DUF2190 family protein [bacterium]|nr:DUF2190 family protein [bacterium]
MGQRVRTAAPGGDWRTLTAICLDAAGHVQYDMVFVHDTAAVVYFEVTVALNAMFYPIYHCDKIVVTKRTGTAEVFAAGDKVYWSGVNGSAVTPNHRSTYYWIGVATEPALGSDETVEIDLKGDKASLTEPL